MPKFSYQAITETGAAAKGEIEAASAEAASSLLAARGYIPTQVQEQRGRSQAGAGAGFSIFSGVGTPELILFTKQFKTLIRSGVPMLTILQVLDTLHADVAPGELPPWARLAIFVGILVLGWPAYDLWRRYAKPGAAAR